MKQTAQFKGKQSAGGAAATKKTAVKAVNLAGTKNPHSPSLNSVAAKLSNSGVTLSKPAAEKTSGPAR